MEPDQICSEQSRSGDGVNPGGGWTFSSATALSSGLAEKCAAELTAAIWVGSGVPCWAEATWAVVFAGLMAQHFTGSRCCDLGHEVLQHEAALRECACAHKIPPIDKTTSTDSSTMAERRIIERILLEVLTTSNDDRHCSQPYRLARPHDNA